MPTGFQQPAGGRLPLIVIVEHAGTEEHACGCRCMHTNVYGGLLGFRRAPGDLGLELLGVEAACGGLRHLLQTESYSRKMNNEATGTLQ